jgi:hypothetical protein
VSTLDIIGWGVIAAYGISIVAIFAYMGWWLIRNPEE